MHGANMKIAVLIWNAFLFSYMQWNKKIYYYIIVRNLVTGCDCFPKIHIYLKQKINLNVI